MIGPQLESLENLIQLLDKTPQNFPEEFVRKAEMEYHGKIRHTLGQMQHISLICRTGNCYTDCQLKTQNVATTLYYFQGLKCYIQDLASYSHKTIFHPSSYYDISNVIRLTWSGNKTEDHTTHNYLECHKYADHAVIINRRRSVSGIIHALFGVAEWWKLQIQLYVASDYTGKTIRYMRKNLKKIKAIWQYMKSLSLHSEAQILHWEYKKSCIMLLNLKWLIL